jgi:tetratricopeptide (TPR) repeat protein
MDDRVPHTSIHAAFMEDCVSGGPGPTPGMAAFITLRLADQFVSGELHRGVEYQIDSTRGFLEDTFSATVERELLLGIVEASRRVLATEDPAHLAGALLEYATHLESEGRLDCALDVIETALRLKGDERAALAVLHGNLLLRMARPGAAMAAFENALVLARRAADEHHALMAQVGCGRVQISHALYAEAAETLSRVEATAASVGDSIAEGEAVCCRAEIAIRRGRRSEAGPLLERGFILLSSSPDTMTFLLALGVELKELEWYDASRQVLDEVFRCAVVPRLRADAVVQLIDLARRQGDRFGFNRWSSEPVGDLPADLEALRELAIGRGKARFGARRAAGRHFRRAGKIANAHRLDCIRGLAALALGDIGENEGWPNR